MGEVVHVKGELHVARGGGEDGLVLDDAGVVDEDGGVADLGADEGGDVGDGGGGGEVAFEVGYRGAGVEGEGLDVEDDGFDGAFGQELDD